MEFHFINTTDADSRMRVRSLVMKGKNKGRKLTRNRQQKPPGQSRTIPPVPAPTRTEYVSHGHPTEDYAVTLPPEKRYPPTAADQIDEYFDAVVAAKSLENPFAGAEWAYFSSPHKITPSMRFLVYQCECSVFDFLFTDSKAPLDFDLTRVCL